MSTGKRYEVLEVGVFHPEETPTPELLEGQVGYIVCNVKNFEEGKSSLPSLLHLHFSLHCAKKLWFGLL